MTGQGQGQAQCGAQEVCAELRAVNNRHLKIQSRIADSFSGIETQLEAEVKAAVRRGAVQLNVSLVGEDRSDLFQLHDDVIESYHQQAQALAEKLGVPQTVTIGQLLTLPGAIVESKGRTSEVSAELSAAATAAVQEAARSLNAMRCREGQSMATELSKQLDRLLGLLDEIQRRSPCVVEEYRQRLHDRIEAALQDNTTEVNASDLSREVVIMADRCDIREEVVRLRSHIEQFSDMLTSETGQGRKLDFLIQEMVRESNTIGSKANDAEIAQRVVDLKTTIEQMRELVQNVE
ncbi:MAG TPA: YicC family protein [Planctomycetaceae bacterium]|nr:YicC family protein [Planctomycetaceae bacterium]